MDHLQILEQNDPTLVNKMEAIERFTQQYESNQQGVGASRSGHITIPVVVHVVYKKSSENISDAQVISQIDVLNEDFRRLNVDSSNTPAIFQGVAADAGVAFCLATVDPDGNPTTGITRTNTRKKFFSYNNDGIKFSSSGGKDAWPRGQYLNIWVGNLSNNLLGYAQFPGGPANTDGVVVLYRAFGRVGNVSSPFDEGRTATHEVGHWLNLRHIWGDGPCGIDDLVADTPESDNPNYGCSWGHVSCGSTDMVQNYMDYSDDDCMNLFTTGQSGRMNALFASGGFRESLLYSNGCNGSAPPPPPSVCSIPTGLNASNITDNSAVLNWSPVADASSYNVRARQTGTTTWATGSTANTSINFTGISSCTDYEFQVESVCLSASSGFSGSSTFTSEGCNISCDAPTGLFVSNITNKSVFLNWSAVGAATSYEAQYREQGQSNWRNKTTSNTSVKVNGIKKGRTYEYRVRAICSGTPSDYSDIETFVAGSSSRVALETKMEIYPNPASDKVIIKFDDEDLTEIEVNMFDLSGKQLLHESFGDGSDVEVDVSGLQNGVYLIVLDHGQGFRTVEKIIINR